MTGQRYAEDPRKEKLKAREYFQVFQLDENLGDDYEEESSSSAGYHTDESCSPTPEPLPADNSCSFLRLEENFSASASGEVTAERLAERYAALYGQAHLHTLDALDALEPLKDAADLKAKILYSVVVVSGTLCKVGAITAPLNALASSQRLSKRTRSLAKYVVVTEGVYSGG